MVVITPATKIIIGNMLVIGSGPSGTSGGMTLSSGVVSSVTIKSLSINYSGSAIYVGGNAPPYTPYSGYGFVLEPGDEKTFDVYNLNRINVFGSGKLTYVGMQY